MPDIPTCGFCKFPLDLQCQCTDCKSDFSTSAFCHVCVEMNRVLVRSQYFSNLHRVWEAEQAERRKRMGL